MHHFTICSTMFFSLYRSIIFYVYLMLTIYLINFLSMPYFHHTLVFSTFSTGEIFDYRQIEGKK